jgi:hypothetical protein
LVSPFWWSSFALLGVLPTVSLARLMPERIQFYLNIDFPDDGKSRPGQTCRADENTGQKLPGAADFAG